MMTPWRSDRGSEGRGEFPFRPSASSATSVVSSDQDDRERPHSPDLPPKPSTVQRDTLDVAKSEALDEVNFGMCANVTAREMRALFAALLGLGTFAIALSFSLYWTFPPPDSVLEDTGCKDQTVPTVSCTWVSWPAYAVACPAVVFCAVVFLLVCGLEHCAILHAVLRLRLLKHPAPQSHNSHWTGDVSGAFWQQCSAWCCTTGCAACCCVCRRAPDDKFEVTCRRLVNTLRVLAPPCCLALATLAVCSMRVQIHVHSVAAMFFFVLGLLYFVVLTTCQALIKNAIISEQLNMAGRGSFLGMPEFRNPNRFAIKVFALSCLFVVFTMWEVAWHSMIHEPRTVYKFYAIEEYAVIVTLLVCLGTMPGDICTELELPEDNERSSDALESLGSLNVGLLDNNTVSSKNTSVRPSSHYHLKDYLPMAGSFDTSVTATLHEESQGGTDDGSYSVSRGGNNIANLTQLP